MNLQEYMFPVALKPVSVDFGDKQINTDRYKSVVRTDTGEIISIVRDTYRIVSNALLINQLLKELIKSNTNFEFDSSHSFIQNSRMRVQVIFRDI